jgi:hypothetical protein
MLALSARWPSLSSSPSRTADSLISLVTRFPSLSVCRTCLGIFLSRKEVHFVFLSMAQGSIKNSCILSRRLSSSLRASGEGVQSVKPELVCSTSVRTFLWPLILSRSPA